VVNEDTTLVNASNKRNAGAVATGKDVAASVDAEEEDEDVERQRVRAAAAGART
jgi:hypothetical protein